MSHEYTPARDEVRRFYVQGEGGLFADEEFDRWLEAHDAEIRAEQIETDAEIAEPDDNRPHPANASDEYLAAWDERRDLAQAIRAQLAPRPPAPELIPGIQAAVDALSIYRKQETT